MTDWFVAAYKQRCSENLIVIGVITSGALFWVVDWVFFSCHQSDTLPQSLVELVCGFILFLRCTSDSKTVQRTALPSDSVFFLLVFFSCTLFMQKSLNHSLSNLQFFPSTLHSHQPPLCFSEGQIIWQVCRRNSLLLNPFIFIHTNRGLEPLTDPRYKARVAFWLTVSFHPNPNEIHKHTSNWVESLAQHLWYIS